MCYNVRDGGSNHARYAGEARGDIGSCLSSLLVLERARARPGEAGIAAGPGRLETRRSATAGERRTVSLRRLFDIPREARSESRAAARVGREAQGEGRGAFKSASAIADNIPLGQPILVGHTARSERGETKIEFIPGCGKVSSIKK